MKKLLLLTITIFGILTINSCSKKDIKIDEPQEETKPEEQPKEEDPVHFTFKTYPADEGRGVIELVSDTTTSKIYFYGNFDGEQDENLLVNAVTYQSPGGDSLYHFILDEQHRVERMYITFPDGTFDTTLLTLSYPHPDTTIVSSYYYNWETNETRLHFRTKTYYKNNKLTAQQIGRFSLSAFKDVSLKTVLGSVIAAVGVVEATGAIIALATTAPAWAIVGAGIAIVAFTNSAMASDEMVLSETPFQGPISPAAHVIPNLPDPSDEPGDNQPGDGDQEDDENIFKDAAIVKEILAVNGLDVSDSRWDSQGFSILNSVLEENGCILSLPLSRYSRVVTVVWEDKGLTTLPESIGHLTKLNVLSLKGNKLTTLPDSIGNLVDLYNLNLSDNQLNTIPASIGNLVKLININLGDNQLNTIPKEVGGLTKLSQIRIGGNQLTSIPSSIGNLVNLSFLELPLNQLNSVPVEIGNLTNLTYLNINNNRLTSIPSSIGNLVNLTTLALSVNQLNAIPKEIGNLTKLTYLTLNDNQLTSIPSSIGNLVSLTRLSLHSNQLNSIPKEIGNLINLPDLSVAENHLTAIPSSIGNLVNLTMLYLGSNQLVTIPESISLLANLKELDLTKNKLTSVPSSVGNLTRLTSLYLADNQLTNIPDFVGNLIYLKTLDVRSNNLKCLPQSVWNLGSSAIQWGGNTREKDGEKYGLCSFGDTNCEDIPCSEQ